MASTLITLILGFNILMLFLWIFAARKNRRKSESDSKSETDSKS